MADLSVVRIGKSPLFRIKCEGVGGSIPDALSGSFTSPAEAEKAIRAFRTKIHSNAKKPKRKSRGNTTDSEQRS